LPTSRTVSMVDKSGFYVFTNFDIRNIRMEDELRQMSGIFNSEPNQGIGNSALFLLILFHVTILFTACTGPMSSDRINETDLTPLYASASNNEGDSEGYGVFFNMIKHDRTPTSEYNHVVPFYFNSSNSDGDKFTLIPPFYYRNKSAFNDDRFYLLSGLKKRGNRNEIHFIYKFFSYTYYDEQPSRWSTFLFPLLDYKTDDGRSNMKLLDVMGLCHLLDISWGVPGECEQDTGTSFSLLDLLGIVKLAGGGDLGGYSDFQLLSLFSSEKLSLFQSHWKKGDDQDGRTVLFPFYWRFKDNEGESFHLWPLFGWDQTVDGGYTGHVLYPLFSYSRNTLHNEWSLDFPWPLIRFMRSENGDYENRLLPFFMSKEDDGAKLKLIPPFYGEYNNDSGYSRRFYTPLYSSYEDPEQGEKGIDILYPLFSHQRSESTKHDRFLPFYYLTTNADYSFIEATPLFWHYSDSSGYVFDLLFPLYAHFGFGEDDNTYSILPILKLIAGRPQRKLEGRKQYDFVWPLVGYGEKNTRKVAWLFPLFTHTSDDDLNQWGFLANIFDFKLEKNQKTFTFLWFIPFSWGEANCDNEEEGS